MIGLYHCTGCCYDQGGAIGERKWKGGKCLILPPPIADYDGEGGSGGPPRTADPVFDDDAEDACATRRGAHGKHGLRRVVVVVANTLPLCCEHSPDGRGWSFYWDEIPSSTSATTWRTRRLHPHLHVGRQAGHSCAGTPRSLCPNFLPKDVTNRFQHSFYKQTLSPSFHVTP